MRRALMSAQSRDILLSMYAALGPWHDAGLCSG